MTRRSEVDEKKQVKWGTSISAGLAAAIAAEAKSSGRQISDLADSALRAKLDQLRIERVGLSLSDLLSRLPADEQLRWNSLAKEAGFEPGTVVMEAFAALAAMKAFKTSERPPIDLAAIDTLTQQLEILRAQVPKL